MKAITYSAFGGIDALTLDDVTAPTIDKGHLLIRVEAASINPIDAKLRGGHLKFMSGSHFPKTIGCDFAGVVEEVGMGVTGFAVGDAVYGGTGSLKHGTLAERISVAATAIAKRPATLDAPTAAAVPIVAVAALVPLRETAAVKPGARVLVNGCTGGVGLYALQLAKAMGAHVTGVCGAEGLAIAKQFGADDVFDYRTTPITEAGKQFDAILELSGKLSFDDSHRLLSDHGIYVDFEPTPMALVGNTIANPFRAHKHKFALTAVNTADLDDLSRRFDAGTLRAAPIRVFELAAYREAFALAERGGVIGKVVIRVC